MRVAYERGLHELGDGLFAHLQPDGGWGWSNAVLICADGTSLLVDTLFEQAMNTLGNGDHYFGNQLLPDNIPIVATAAAVEEMRALPPALAHAFFNDVDPGPEFDAWAQRTVRRFDFTGIEQRLPTQTFTGRHALSVGDRRVDLVALGPAHTAGDAIAWVPDAATVFTGDILFIEGTPVMWAGPAANWLAACDRILDLDASVIVPGHGPVTDASGVRDVQRYLTCIREEARARFDAGMSDVDAADEIDLADFRDWGDRERIAVNVATLQREFDPALPEVSVPELFARMARWAARHPQTGHTWGGWVRPEADVAPGTATVNGKHYAELPAPLHEIEALLEPRAIHTGRSAYNHLLAMAQTHGIGRRRVQEVIDLVGLGEVAHKRAGGFSLGMGQRLGVASALLGDPQTLILDEPANDLDPGGILWMRTLLKGPAAEGRTVFLSSHPMAEMAQTAEHLIVVGRGRPMADTTVDELVAQASHDAAVLVRSPQAGQLREALGGEGVAVTSAEHDVLEVPGRPSAQIGTAAAEHGIILHELIPQTASLEQAFMRLTGGEVEYHAELFGTPPAAPAAELEEAAA